jgi:hypothetical protein
MYKKRSKIKIVLDCMKAGNDHQTALKKARLSRTAWWNWEQKDPRLEKLRRAAYDHCDLVRATTAENRLFQRIEEDRATPVEMIFFLTNRLPERWKDKRAVVNNTNVITNKIGQDAGERQFANDHDRELAAEMREWLRERTNGNGHKKTSPG